MATYRIAVIPGDGIGKEVVPEGLRVLEAIGRRFDIFFVGTIFPGAVNSAPSTDA
jgi:tartrate dehydrogenase/decarboxylase/D-malate dehydrogenase